MPALRQLLRRALAAALPRRRFLVRGPADSGTVALTFDDGPNAIYTPRLLDLLRDHDLRATFFVVGAKAEQHPELLTRMIAEGHAIGHHSWTHSEPAETRTATLLAELKQTDALLAHTASVSVSIVRPPKGQLTWQKTLRLLLDGRRIILWSMDPKDYAMASSAPLLRWAKEAAFQAGEIILLHDVHPHCLDVIPTLASRLAELGLTAVPLQDWLPTARPAP